MTDVPLDRLFALYPCLAETPPALRAALVSGAAVKHVAAGTVLFDERNECSAFPMVISGAVRVTKAAPNGRELQLYRVLPGESCVITSSCLLGHAAYNARGEAETDTTLVALPGPLFARLMTEHEAFRAYVFRLFSERVADLMELVEAVAFQRLDQRLAALLLAREPVLHTTHQQLADELGSVREIVSRLLKGFSEQGMVTLGRERIEVTDASALRRVAGQMT
jgi:CRP/FNR family transcriptional regulator